MRRRILGGFAGASVFARNLFGVPVVVPSPGEYVAVGAARQAAWARAAEEGDDTRPRWPWQFDVLLDVADLESGAAVAESYRRFRETVHRTAT